jgi:hypothetical protein
MLKYRDYRLVAEHGIPYHTELLYLSNALVPAVPPANWFGKPSLVRRIWYGTNVLGLIALVGLSKPLWLFDLKPGTQHWGGPGDGLYFLFFILAPWLFFTFLNVVVLINDLISRPQRSTMLIRSGALIAWAAVAVLLSYLLRAPEGVTLMGS